jgi:hypothetical protein
MVQSQAGGGCWSLAQVPLYGARLPPRVSEEVAVAVDDLCEVQGKGFVKHWAARNDRMKLCMQAPQVPMVYQLLKSIGHSTMALSEVVAPYLDNPRNQGWRSLAARLPFPHAVRAG